VLGLPQIVDHLFDVSPLSDVALGRCRVVRPGSETAAAHGARAAGLLAGTRGGWAGSGRRRRKLESKAGAGPGGRHGVAARAPRVRSSRAPGHDRGPTRPGRGRGRFGGWLGRAIAAGATRAGRKLGRSAQPLRWARGL